MNLHPALSALSVYHAALVAIEAATTTAEIAAHRSRLLWTRAAAVSALAEAGMALRGTTAEGPIARLSFRIEMGTLSAAGVKGAVERLEAMGEESDPVAPRRQRERNHGERLGAAGSVVSQ